jgi:hypothetical protein
MRSNRFAAVLLLLDCALNSVYLNDITYGIPFAIAAIEFYFIPQFWAFRRWLILFTALVVCLSIFFGVSIFMDGIAFQSSGKLIQGFNLITVNLLVAIHFALTSGIK